MITDNQINALSEDELAYLHYCCKAEWDSKNMGYDFQFHFLKSFKANVIQLILNKHKHLLKEEYENIINIILNKLEDNK
jgi:hypothetical protein